MLKMNMHYLHIRRQVHANSALHALSASYETADMDKNKQLGAALRRFRKISGLKQAEVAEAVEIDQTTLSRIETGKSGTDQDMLSRLAVLYGVRVSEIYAAIEEELAVREPAATYWPRKMEGITTVPLIGWVQAGLWTDTKEPIPADQVEEWVPTSAKVSNRAYALQVEGESMINPRGSPSFPPMCRIIVEPSRVAQPGDFVIAQVDLESAATFKKLTQDGGRLYLTPLNAQYPTLSVDSNVRILGVVLRIAEHMFVN